ncbi:MAG: FGGY family carbohydrate kinase, partial [Sulfobacillus sp.]|nr:FGGY family carbohydrate kinase [Sulfobacillus sp.]
MAYAIGVDFGTLSGRALLLDLDSGQEVAAVEVPYPHGVLDERLPAGGDNLPPDWALQDPDDYLYVLEKAVPELLRRSRVTADQIVGIGVDATSCTVLPVLEDGTPLCRLPEFRQRPHAWPKLWKHHAAQPWATRLTEVAAETGESFLSRYGGRISSEWYYPKLLEIFQDDPETYRTMRWFVEATDWIVWQLTGQLKRNSCTAGYKALWDPQKGIP